MKKVFVIIVSYKGFLWYDRCFGSLMKSTIPLTVVVVDNASNDGTIEFIKNKYPEIHLIESKKNLGFGRANNLGIQYALDNDCDYVFLLNQDAWVEPSTIEMLLEIHQKHPKYGILSPIHLNCDKSAIESGLMHYIQDYKVTDSEFINDLYFGRLKDVYMSKYVNAAAWLLPRNTIEQIGGFDPLFFHYGEDDNYISRVLYHKLWIGICPKAKVVHNTEVVGVRVDTKEENERRRQLILLIRFTDLNNMESLRRYVFYLFRKSITKFIACDCSAVKRNLRDLRFLLKNIKNINVSRMVNKMSGRNWIR